MMSSTSSLWTSQPVLQAIAAAGIYNDSKDFVDSPLLVDPEVAWSRWSALPTPPPAADLEAFVNATFGPPGHDLVAWQPPDFQPSPPLLARLPAGPVRQFASSLNELWPKLGRKLGPAVRAQPNRTTLLPAAHGFIVPGGRFREAYYWDSYWVVLGLLACGMRQTAISLTRNLLDAVTNMFT